MSFGNYLTENWGLLIVILGMAIMLYSDIHLERNMVRRIFITNTLLLVYSITTYIEGWLGNQSSYTVARPILSAVNYSLIGVVFVFAITVMFPMQRVYLFIPAVLNAILCFISIPTGIVFTITEDNHFMRGTLGHLTYFVSALYLIYLIYCLFFRSKIQKEDYLLLGFLSLNAILCMVLPLILIDVSNNLFTLSITLNVFIYYVYLLQQFTKRDPLTKLLNRQSYYSDAEKHFGTLTAVVTMDMNGLKWINDSEGHIAGDKALVALGDCFWRSAHRGQRVYRIGGDEYVILCFGATEQEVKELIVRIKDEVAKVPYTCAVGYAMKNKDSTLDSLYNEADANLYIEKKQYYEESGLERRKR